MDKVLFPEVADTSKRFQMIKDNADEFVPNYSYLRSFDGEEVIELKDELSETSIEIDTLEHELKDIKETYKAQIAPKVKQKKSLLKCLREKGQPVKEEVYAYRDQANGEYGIYNGEGMLISSRPLRPAERQKTIFTSQREGTNN